MVGRSLLTEVDRQPARPGAADQVEGGAGRTAVHPGLGAFVGDRAEHPTERVRRLGPVDGAVPPEAGRRRHRTGQHGGQRGLVDLYDEPVDAGQPAAEVADVAAHALRECLGEIATRAVVGEDLVAAGPLDGCGQGPRPGDLDLERPGVRLGCLLQRVEVLREQAPGPTLVDPRSVGESPARRLQVGAQLCDHGQRASGHRGGGAAARHLRQVREVRQLAEHDPHGLVVRTLVVARHRADAGSEGHQWVRAIVAEPTTRVPS